MRTVHALDVSYLDEEVGEYLAFRAAKKLVVMSGKSSFRLINVPVDRDVFLCLFSHELHASLSVRQLPQLFLSARSAVCHRLWMRPMSPNPTLHFMLDCPDLPFSTRCPTDLPINPGHLWHSQIIPICWDICLSWCHRSFQCITCSPAP